MGTRHLYWGFSPSPSFAVYTYFIPESLVTVREQTSQPVVFDNVIVVIVVEGSGVGRHTLGEVVMAAVQETAAAATTHTPVYGLVTY